MSTLIEWVNTLVATRVAREEAERFWTEPEMQAADLAMAYSNFLKLEKYRGWDGRFRAVCACGEEVWWEAQTGPECDCQMGGPW